MMRASSSARTGFGVDVVERAEELLFCDIIASARGQLPMHTFHQRRARSLDPAPATPHGRGICGRLQEFGILLRPRRFSSVAGRAYCALCFSQPPALEDELGLRSRPAPTARSESGVPCPRLSPLFLPVSESTELGAKLAQFCQQRLRDRHKDGVPDPDLIHTDRRVDVEGRHAGNSDTDGAGIVGHAMSMFEKMMLSACDAWVSGFSARPVALMAARTSGGRLVEVQGDQFDEAVLAEMHGKALL